ncbi:hypothetical protein OPS25_07130 [Alteromonas ponticola]|uniref:Uncharacterized protein n=1 Tax=Alteromonas aquimaris TaxID=2998417 RepID=A0ABT3P673_9ALTE|nr:hypothetical protein [Alteromonas aquimaris]MCW8108264.1 hypothetical protein [Alteromonas aquimaris]
MKLFKRKLTPQPSNRFEKYLQSQPVFNWFDRYNDNKRDQASTSQSELMYNHWMVKQVNQ